jgi:hypothetical protein
MTKDSTSVTFLEINPEKDLAKNSDFQIDRILSKDWKNPFEVLELKFNVPDDQVKEKRNFFVKILHPNKTDNPRAKDAFNIIE